MGLILINLSLEKFETAIAMCLSIGLYFNFHLNNHKQTQNKMYVNKDA